MGSPESWLLSGATPLTAGLTAAIQGMKFFDTTADGLKINERIEANPGLFNASVGECR